MSNKFEKFQERLAKHKYGIPIAVDDPTNPTVFIFLTHYEPFKISDDLTIPAKMGRVFHKLYRALWPTRNIESLLIKGEWYNYDPKIHPHPDELLKSFTPLDTVNDVRNFLNRYNSNKY